MISPLNGSFRSNELKQLISEQNRKREESMHALDMIAREKEHKTESDRMKQQAKVAETLEDINKKILNKEIKLREEIQDKHVQLEKVDVVLLSSLCCRVFTPLSILHGFVYTMVLHHPWIPAIKLQKFLLQKMEKLKKLISTFS